MKHATSQRAQVAAATGEEGDEEVEYGDEEEEEEEEVEESEVPEMPPPKSAMKKGKKKAAFMISGPAKGGQRAISARPTQREQRTTSTTFLHNWERAKQQCHEILGCSATQVRHHYRQCLDKTGPLCVDESGNPFVGEVAKVYSGGLRESFLWAVSARLEVGLSVIIHKFKIRGDHTRAVPTAKDLLVRKYHLPNLDAAVQCAGIKLWVSWATCGYARGNVCGNVIRVCCRPVTRGHACGYRCGNTFSPNSVQRRSLQF